jgi:hypothetical protein
MARSFVMYTTDSAQQAAGLRALADAVETAGLPHVHVSVYLRPDLFAAKADQVADVDRLAAALGLSASTVRDGSSWYHEARQDRLDGALNVHIRVHVEAPPERCVCGAMCEHLSAVTA